MSPFSSSGWRIFPAEGFVSVYFSPVSGGFGTLGWSVAYRFFQWVEDLGRWGGLWRTDSSSGWRIWDAGRKRVDTGENRGFGLSFVRKTQL